MGGGCGRKAWGLTDCEERGGRGAGGEWADDVEERRGDLRSVRGGTEEGRVVSGPRMWKKGMGTYRLYGQEQKRSGW